MKIKTAQSIMDIILPHSLLFIRKSPISNKEATALLDIWKEGNKDAYGRLKIPNEIDAITVASLIEKGYLSSVESYRAIHSAGPSAVSFTKKAKEVIKKLILHSESSSFENSEDKKDYETILTLAGNLTKTASRQEKKSNNWLQRARWK